MVKIGLQIRWQRFSTLEISRDFNLEDFKSKFFAFWNFQIEKRPSGSDSKWAAAFGSKSENAWAIRKICLANDLLFAKFNVYNVRK